MRLRLNPFDEQVMVITGASSGIGLVTAKQAAQQGACVVLAARNEKALQDATNAIRRTGGRAAFAVGDAAKHALKAFTDALRMELEEEGVPISVTLVKPASIDTPFFEKALQ